MSAFRSPYAMFVDLSDRPVLVVGGGKIAARKAADLVAAGARVTVVAPSVVDSISANPAIRWFERSYRRGEVASYRLAITATDDPEVNRQVSHDAEAANVFVNSADDPTNCSFILPSVIRRGDLRIAISTNGKSPAMAAWLRRRLSPMITDAHLDGLEMFGQIRTEQQAIHGTSESTGWADALDDELFDLIASGDPAGAEARVRAALGLHSETTAV